jgi:hypothetical protein
MTIPGNVDWATVDAAIQHEVACNAIADANQDLFDDMAARGYSVVVGSATLATLYDSPPRRRRTRTPASA